MVQVVEIEQVEQSGRRGSLGGRERGSLMWERESGEEEAGLEALLLGPVKVEGSRVCQGGGEGVPSEGQKAPSLSLCGGAAEAHPVMTP